MTIIIPWITRYKKDGYIDLFEKKDIEIKLIEDASSAISEFKNKYDLIITDILLQPGKDISDEGLIKIINEDKYKTAYLCFDITSYVIKKIRQGINKETPILALDYLDLKENGSKLRDLKSIKLTEYYYNPSISKEDFVNEVIKYLNNNK